MPGSLTVTRMTRSDGNTESSSNPVVNAVPGLGVLRGAQPPGGFARLAAHIALDGQQYEQPDQYVLDHVA